LCLDEVIRPWRTTTTAPLPRKICGCF
jgi:hypothetical protein